MTKEELKQEAEDIVYGMGYDTYESDGHSDFAVQDILIKFAESREKRIADLEAYNEKLLDGDIEKHNKIVALGMENAELKDDNKVMADNYSKMEQKFYNQLSKAKEIIKNLLSILNIQSETDIQFSERCISEAENFLSSSEIPMNILQVAK